MTANPKWIEIQDHLPTGISMQTLTLTISSYYNLARMCLCVCVHVWQICLFAHQLEGGKDLLQLNPVMTP